MPQKESITDKPNSSKYRYKTGIMGGTFNPIHNGHIELAKCAYESFLLDEILFIPSGISWLKAGQDIPSSTIRCKMTELAIKEYDYFSLSSIEAEREGNSYSYETILALKEQNPFHDYYFIMGADSLKNIEKWVHPEILMRECTLLVAVRDDVDKYSLRQQIEALMEKYICDIRLLSMPRFDISSTQIRRAVSQGAPICEFVPPSVEAYIKEKGLYLADKKIQE